MDVIYSEPKSDLDPFMETHLMKKRKKRLQNSSRFESYRAKKAITKLASDAFRVLSGETNGSILLSNCGIRENFKYSSMRKVWRIKDGQKRVCAIHDFAASQDGSFPSPPRLLKYCGFSLDE